MRALPERVNASVKREAVGMLRTWKAGWFAFGLVLFSAYSHAADPPATLPSGVAEQAAAMGSTLDLNDPRVQARLRASGIDPDELEKLLEAQQAAGAAKSQPDGTPQFPPVPPPPMAQAAAADSSDDVHSKADETEEARHFGYDVFKMSPKTFEPLAFGPVTPQYLIGPGDEVIVNVWGAQEMYAKVEVNREGYIFLPDLGQVLVNGYTLEGLRGHLEQRLAKIYSGLRSDGRGGSFLDVTLGKLRSIQVFVLGEAVQPGGYTMSATSTVMSALYYAGGPTLGGSMRNVRLLRGNKLLREIDLYDYVAKGDQTQDTRLENGDVVFVPPVGVRVDLKGEVQNPAIYELREGETLKDLLRLAGGLKSTAYIQRIQVERTIPFDERSPMSQEDRKILDVDLRSEVGAQTRLVDGDMVRVFRIGDLLVNTVKLVGTAVYKPGTYQYAPGMTVADLVRSAGGLLGDAFLEWAHVIRTFPDKSKQLLSFHLGLALERDPKQDLVLQELDEVQVFSADDMRDEEYVRIQGQVRQPGRFDFIEGMTLADLILKAGGLRESAYRLHAEVSRIDPTTISVNRTTQLLRVSMGDSLSGDAEAGRFKLQKNDMVFIREIPNWGLQENVWVTGEVPFPGMYSLTSKTERLSSLINRAGGLEETAYLAGAVFIRNKDEIGRMAIDFRQALREKNRKKASKFDLVLIAGDSIHIPMEPTTVKVTGQVGFPSSVIWEKGRDADYYIEQAGGLLESADGGKIRVIMANGRIKRSGWFSSPEPDAGAQIVVPAKAEKKDTEVLKNMAQIVSIVTGAVTTIYLISRTTD
jgi:protein involved in polysaccharide export with SLBB domain